MTVKRFTAFEATASLSFVRPVAVDAVALSERLREATAAYRAEKARPLPSQAELNDRRREIEWLRREIGVCSGDVTAAGGDLADPAQGIVDFPAVLDGNDVRLCWRVGEQAVEHWHLDDEDHDQRHPLPVPVHA